MNTPLTLQTSSPMAAPCRAPEGGLTAGPPPQTIASSSRPERRNLVERLTVPSHLWALCAGSLLLLAWSLFVRLPLSRAQLPFPTPAAAASPEPPSSRFTPSDVERLRAQASTAHDSLVRDRAEFHQLLARIETEAQMAGLRLHLTVLPPLKARVGTNRFIAYPATAEVSFVSAGTSPAQPYQAVEAWLASLGQLPRHTEITDLLLTGDLRGLSTARVDFQVLGQADHGNPASE